MTKLISHSILLLSLFLIFGCNFDTLEHENITDNFWIVTIDLSENRSVCYSTNNDGSYSSLLISGTVNEIYWNKKFILVKQDPLDGIKKKVYETLFEKNWEKKISKFKSQKMDEIFFDKQFHKFVDSITQVEIENRLLTGEINLSKKEVLFLYYLIDIKDNPTEPMIFFSKDSLQIVLKKFNVGLFTNKKIYSS